MIKYIVMLLFIMTAVSSWSTESEAGTTITEAVNKSEMMEAKSAILLELARMEKENIQRDSNSFVIIISTIVGAVDLGFTIYGLIARKKNKHVTLI